MTNKNQTLEDIIKKWNDIDEPRPLTATEVYILAQHLAPKVLLKEEIDWGEIKEKTLVAMLNQIPSKYHNNPDKIAEFGDIIEETIFHIKKLLGVKE